jgi:ribulose-phosphate 3-epimerase
MTVNPGYGGQELIKSTIHKVEQLNDILNQGTGQRPLIEVDGGINSENIAQFANAGANVFVAGNSIFGHVKGIRAGIRELQDALLPVRE